MSETDEREEHNEEQPQNLPAVREDEGYRRVSIMAGAEPRALVPIDFDGAYRIAVVAARGGLTTRGLETVEKCMIAIMHGMEVGLTPMAALQSIAVINGRPTIFGDGAMALVRGSGICEWVKETYTGTFPNDDFKAICRIKRKGDPEVIEAEFSVADAKRARLWDMREKVTRKSRGGGNYEALNDSPWFKYPKRMLKMRARWALRDGFADVMKGLHMREEIEDMEATPAEPDVPVRRAPPPPEEVKAGDKPAVKDDPISSGPIATQATAQAETTGDTTTERRAPPPPAETADSAVDEALWLDSLENAFAASEDTASLSGEQTRLMMPMKGKVSDVAWKKAIAKINEHLKRVQGA